MFLFHLAYICEPLSCSGIMHADDDSCGGGGCDGDGSSGGDSVYVSWSW